MNATKLPTGPRWCISTIGCHDYDLDALAALAARFGVEEIELSFIEGRVDLVDYFREHFEKPEQLLAALSQRGLRIPVMNSRVPLAKLDNDAKAGLLALAEWADACGTSYISVHEGAPGTDGKPDFEQLQEAIKWWRGERVARGWRVDLILETSDFATSSDLLSAFQSTLAEPIGLLWDSHSTWHHGREDSHTTWAVIRPWVRHVHFKDSVPTTLSRYDVAYALPGDGKFPIYDLFNLLWQDGYEGAWSLEWERRFHPFLPPLEEALSALSRITAQPETADAGRSKSAV